MNLLAQGCPEASAGGKPQAHFSLADILLSLMFHLAQIY